MQNEKITGLSYRRHTALRHQWTPAHSHNSHSPAPSSTIWSPAVCKSFRQRREMTLPTFDKTNQTLYFETHKSKHQSINDKSKSDFIMYNLYLLSLPHEATTFNFCTLNQILCALKLCEKNLLIFYWYQKGTQKSSIQ